MTLDLDAVGELLRKSDVLTVGFTLFPERLLVDTRANDKQGQFAEMVEPVGSVQERYVWLGRHRGSFGAPEAFAFFVWPHTVRGLIERDILAPLRERLSPLAADALNGALREAAEAENRAIKEMVRGTEAWPAVWQAAN
ncbi:MAG: hypothetical protein C0506_02735 [Anaerolinea sp.]|nr:hypothetical protein [Anaerolinea sp.]